MPSGSRSLAASRPPVFDGKSCVDDQSGNLFHRIFVISGDKYRHVGRGIAGRVEELGEDGVEGLDHLGAGRGILDFVGGGSLVTEEQTGEIGLQRIADVNDDLARERWRGGDLKSTGIGNGEDDDPRSGDRLCNGGAFNAKAFGKAARGPIVACRDDQLSLPGKACGQALAHVSDADNCSLHRSVSCFRCDGHRDTSETFHR